MLVAGCSLSYMHASPGTFLYCVLYASPGKASRPDSAQCMNQKQHHRTVRPCVFAGCPLAQHTPCFTLSCQGCTHTAQGPLTQLLPCREGLPQRWKGPEAPQRGCDTHMASCMWPALNTCANSSLQTPALVSAGEPSADGSWPTEVPLTRSLLLHLLGSQWPPVPLTTTHIATHQTARRAHVHHQHDGRTCTARRAPCLTTNTLHEPLPAIVPLARLNKPCHGTRFRS